MSTNIANNRVPQLRLAYESPTSELAAKKATRSFISSVPTFGGSIDLWDRGRSPERRQEAQRAYLDCSTRNLLTFSKQITQRRRAVRSRHHCYQHRRAKAIPPASRRPLEAHRPHRSLLLDRGAALYQLTLRTNKAPRGSRAKCHAIHRPKSGPLPASVLASNYRSNLPNHSPADPPVHFTAPIHP